MVDSNNSNSTDCVGDGFYCEFTNPKRAPFCFENCTYPPTEPVSQISAVIQIVVCAVIFFPSLIGNLCVVYVVIRDKRLHTTTNYFLTNLSIAELMITIFNMWPHLVYNLSLMQDPSDFTGALYCRVTRFTQVLGVSGCTLTLTLIACDRFFGIIFAMRAHLTERKASVFVFLIWSISIVLSLPMLIFNNRKYRLWVDHVEVWCEMDFPGNGDFGKRLYFIILVVGFYIVPAIITTIAYVCIVIRLWSARTPGERLRSDVQDRSLVQQKQRRKVITMLVLILVVFYVCWTPLQLYNLFTQVKLVETAKKLSWVNPLCHFLAYSNACLHPIMFAGYNQNFRRAFRSQCPIFCGKRASGPHSRPPPNTSDATSTRTGYTRFSLPFGSLQMEATRTGSHCRGCDGRLPSNSSCHEAKL